jgi:uncharacterized protein (DUF488 family)
VKLYTIGYGGRRPDDFVAMLKGQGVNTVVDVRLRPDRASMGCYSRAKSPAKGIARLLSDAGILYVSAIELGNVFLHHDDWRERYRKLLERAGDLLTERLLQTPTPLCLMCAERKPEMCHRALIAGYLAERGWQVEHLE